MTPISHIHMTPITPQSPEGLKWPMRHKIAGFLLSALAVSAAVAVIDAQQKPPARPQPAPVADYFEVYEQSIVDLQAALTANRVTSRGLVDSYLARIQAYDQSGPRLNSVVLINQRAREEADALDAE